MFYSFKSFLNQEVKMRTNETFHEFVVVHLYPVLKEIKSIKNLNSHQFIFTYHLYEMFQKRQNFD